MTAPRRTVALLHPDLGIGGAERLVVDVALALQSHGHKVQFYTSHHDVSHAFRETIDGTVTVNVAGDWLPRHIFGYLHAVFAYLRMVYLAMYFLFFACRNFDVIVCDQVSVCIPVLRLCGRPIIFYCHFPDQLLASRHTWLKRIYRWPLDALEQWTTGMADRILVNSNFTKQTFKETFTRLRYVDPQVLYPSLNFGAFDAVPQRKLKDLLDGRDYSFVFLSINRYERKKNLPLAIKALGVLKTTLASKPELWEKIHLVMAGGYDPRVAENVEHFQELTEVVAAQGLQDKVTFLRSFTDEDKLILLHNCSCLLYTPANEHFGIVPLEAMYCRRPVVAVNSGGPLETVSSGGGKQQTGILCAPRPYEFAEAMAQMVCKKSFRTALGKAGRDRVQRLFSFEAFANQLDQLVTELVER